MTDKQRAIIKWIEEMTTAKYKGGSITLFIEKHYEEAKFNSLLNDKEEPNFKRIEK